MLNNSQIKLVQTAARAAGLRTKYCDGRYRMLLGQYRQSNGSPVASCKQLNNWQLDDFLAICESLGWQYPGKPADFYQEKVRKEQLTNVLSQAQLNAIGYLAGDLGWNTVHLNNFVTNFTNDEIDNIVALSKLQAFKIIEALKAILGRQENKKYSNLKQIQEDTEVANGTKSQVA